MVAPEYRLQRFSFLHCLLLFDLFYTGRRGCLAKCEWLDSSSLIGDDHNMADVPLSDLVALFRAKRRMHLEPLRSNSFLCRFTSKLLRSCTEAFQGDSHAGVYYGAARCQCRCQLAWCHVPCAMCHVPCAMCQSGLCLPACRIVGESDEPKYGDMVLKNDKLRTSEAVKRDDPDITLTGCSKASSQERKRRQQCDREFPMTDT